MYVEVGLEFPRTNDRDIGLWFGADRILSESDIIEDIKLNLSCNRF